MIIKDKNRGLIMAEMKEVPSYSWFIGWGMFRASRGKGAPIWQLNGSDCDGLLKWVVTGRDGKK
jgi:hypothetical protein